MLNRSKQREGNYLTHPQTIHDILLILEKAASATDLDERVHYLEVIRETVSRFPGLTGRGVKGKIQRALNALNPRSSVDSSELPQLIQSVYQLLKSRAARRAAQEYNLWTVARRGALLNRARASSKQDLFDRTIAFIRRTAGSDRLADSQYLLRHAYNAVQQALAVRLSNQGEDGEQPNSLEWLDIERGLTTNSRSAAHTQAEVDYTSRIVGAHMQAFIQEQKEAEASGGEGALMTPPEGILDEGIKFLIYLASNPQHITGFDPLPPPAIQAIKKLESDDDFRRAVYDQVESEYGIDLDQAQAGSSLGIGQMSQLLPGTKPEQVDDSPAKEGAPPYSAEEFGQAMDRGQALEQVEDLHRGEFKDLPLSVIAQILQDAPKEDDQFGYEGKKFILQHVDWQAKVGLVQRVAQSAKGQQYRVKVGGTYWFEYRCWESDESEDADLWHRSHQQVKVLKMEEPGIGENEDDRAEEGCPAGFLVKFSDGYRGTAMEDELLDSKSHFIRPDPSQRARKLTRRKSQKDKENKDDDEDDKSWAPLGKDITIPEEEDRPDPLFRERAEKKKKENKEAQLGVEADKHRDSAPGRGPTSEVKSLQSLFDDLPQMRGDPGEVQDRAGGRPRSWAVDELLLSGV